MDSTLRNHLLSDNFWNDLDILVKIMEPMVTALKLFESDTSIISTVYFHFKNLMDQVDQIICDFSDNLQELIINRWEYAFNSIYMIAYILDPQFLNESKINEIESDCYKEFTEFTKEKFGYEESVELFAELVKFRNKNSPYNNEIIWGTVNILNNPSLWWQSWPNSKLQQLAIRIFSIPTSSAAAERNFSNFGFIHNKIRNRLKNERVKKLVYIYGNLRINNGGFKINLRKRKETQITNFNDNEQDNENTNSYNSESYNSDSDNSTILEFESNVISLDDEE